MRAKNEKELKAGKKPTEAREVEMNNFQNPQVRFSYFLFELSSLMGMAFSHLAFK